MKIFYGRIDVTEQSKRYWAEVDLGIARENYNLIRSRLNADTKLCCVVKANAYGHGALPMANLYQSLGADFFAVANIDEAIGLRRGGIVRPILILGYTPPEYARVLSENSISQTVFSLDYAEELNSFAASAGVTIKIHVKLDTGMGRIGFSYKDTENIRSVEEIAAVCRMPSFIPEGIFTHFSVADEGDKGAEYTKAQYELFLDACKRLENMGISFSIRHAANSASAVAFPEYQLDMVRAGILLYGLLPSQKLTCEGIRPVLSLRSVVSFVKECKAGERISYGGDFVTSAGMKIATVPGGYADGYRRFAEGKQGCVLVNGKFAKITGRICMDQFMIDVTHIEGVKRGDIVTVLGEDGGETISADSLASLWGTINYEVLCGIGERVPRIYKE